MVVSSCPCEKRGSVQRTNIVVVSLCPSVKGLGSDGQTHCGGVLTIIGSSCSLILVVVVFLRVHSFGGPEVRDSIFIE